jgi:hypothetical protein
VSSALGCAVYIYTYIFSIAENHHTENVYIIGDVTCCIIKGYVYVHTVVSFMYESAWLSLSCWQNAAKE